MSLYLASTSARRQQLLRQIDVEFVPLEVNVAEIPGSDETPEEYVTRVACDKARAGYRLVSDKSQAIVLAGDTEVVLDKKVFGKAPDINAARHMLSQLSGRTHRVISTVCMLTSGKTHTRQCISEVSFMPLDSALIDAYLETSEYVGKAGAYAIQGKAAQFISHLSGSYSAVMGLPLFETASLLRQFNVKFKAR